MPRVWDGGPLDLGTREMDPRGTGGALNHRPATVRFPAEARDLLLFIIVIWK